MNDLLKIKIDGEMYSMEIPQILRKMADEIENINNKGWNDQKYVGYYSELNHNSKLTWQIQTYDKWYDELNY